MNGYAMLLLSVIIISIQYEQVFPACSVSRCDWTQWKSWSSCSQTCGGGQRRRTRSLCCKSSLSLNACLNECSKTNSGFYGYGTCNQLCFNGGFITSSGCRCPDKYYGHCCSFECPTISMCKRRTCTQSYNVKCQECYEDNVLWKRTNSYKMCERMCSFANHYCWPGTCTSGLTKNCQCAPGFKRVSRTGSQIFSGETTCQIDTKPVIDTCRTVFVGPNGEKKDTKSYSSSNECRFLQDTYGNYQPKTIEFDMISSFTVDTTAFNYNNRPRFIKEEDFGISDTTLIFKRKLLAGTDVFLSRHYQKRDISSSIHVTSRVANHGSVTVATSTHNISNGQALCIAYEAKAGGYLKSYDVRHSNTSTPISYTKTTFQRQLCFRYDDAPPEHCLKLKSCSSGEPLKIANRVTRDPISDVSFTGWSDPIPTGGNAIHASSLKSYEISVHQVLQGKGQQFVHETPVYVRKINSSSSITNILLNLTSDTPTLYCIQLEVKDVADNVRYARRFLLYDNTSFIETNDGRSFIVISATSSTSYAWQTHHGDICLSWENHFYNLYYLYNTMLDPIKPDAHGLITGIYEQTDGLLPVKGTPNVGGIVLFKVSWSLNNGNLSNEIDVPNFLNQNYCRKFNAKDGETYNFKIRPIDIVGNTYQDNRSVHIDRSHPHINNSCLEKDGYKMLFVDFANDISVLSMTFEALDPHSGIKVIEWRFGMAGTQMDLLSDAIGVQRLNTKCALGEETCYCPSVGFCEQYLYNVQLNKLHLIVTHIDAHDKNYTFTIKVTNNAELSTFERIDVIVDNSPPEKGVIFEGPLDTNNFTVPIHWYGFNDNESGIHSFRLGLSQRCLSKSELHMGNIPDIEFYIELNSLSSFMSFSANFSGKRYITIIALNNALTPSEVACSPNGITGLFAEDGGPVSRVIISAIGGTIGLCVLLGLAGVTMAVIIYKRRRMTDNSQSHSNDIREESGYENITIHSGPSTDIGISSPIYNVGQQACENRQGGKDNNSDSLYTDLDKMRTPQESYEEINMAVIKQRKKEDVYENLQIQSW